ncbi:GntR family transcriptional regulator [Caenibacillus caldisaponilyticus]|uniref:GntR family transcriptional regulator n=1 Tax=Caenibacillus caldisaponilyticus TaxID=1674942 RepID=UPI0009885368|nr:GntR family transcriptional regulator [Caenibacillus caldisaponilyticus]
MIDKRSPVPIYYQIEEHIKKMIDTHQLKPGDAIPSERELTEAFQVSRMTVRQAITDLVNAGLLIRKKGKGTFVAEPKIEQPLQGLTSFTEDMQRRGMKAGAKILRFSKIPSDESIAQKLDIRTGAAIYEIKRIRFADAEPMALERTYLPAELVQGLTADIFEQSLYAYIENVLHYRIAHADQVIEATTAGHDEIEHLNMAPGSPVLRIHRLTFLENGQPLEWVDSAYRGDRYKFVISLKRD